MPIGRSQALAMFFVACCRRWRECVVSDCFRAHGMMSSQPGVEASTFPFKRPAFADGRWQAVALVPDPARASAVAPCVLCQRPLRGRLKLGATSRANLLKICCEFSDSVANRIAPRTTGESLLPIHFDEANSRAGLSGQSPKLWHWSREGGQMVTERVERRLAAILAVDVAGYSRLMGSDELGTLVALKTARRDIVDPAIAAHSGRIIKTTGDGMLVVFASVVDAVTCAMFVQSQMAQLKGVPQSIAFRIGINVGDIIIESDDIFGDGVNIAARVENECEPGRVWLSDDAYRQVRGKTTFAFDDLGERSLKNIDRPVRIYSVRGLSPAMSVASPSESKKPPLPPDRPSIAVLPFSNMSGDPEQEYFADGMVEDIITALSHFKSLFVIARNSSFTYKGRAVDIKQVGRANLAFVMCWKVACARRAGGCVSPASSSRQLPVHIFGRTRSTALWKIYSISRMKSQLE
jgi:class 3 adenylate cyclase